MTDPLHLLLDALAAGSRDLSRHAGLLNRINVYPVMDGDTGINMQATLAAIPSGGENDLSDIRDVDLSLQLTKPLLRGARGNSGIILAEFLAGVLDRIAAEGGVSFASFRQGVVDGRQRAYRAVTDPREGTMLTLMRLLSDALAHAETPFLMADHRRLERALLSGVLDTPRQLDTLRAAGVVDSGALGFYLLAAGFILVLPALFDPEGARLEIEKRRSGAGGAPMRDVAEQILPAYAAKAKAAGVPERYCVNLVVTGAVDTDCHQVFSHLGASLNVARVDTLTKLHIHTDDPELVAQAAARIGEVTDIVIQDMQEALTTSGDTQSAPSLDWMPIRVAADSAISLSHTLSAELGIVRIDNYINVAGRMVSDRDIDMAGLLREMKAGARFTTAQVSPDDADRFLNRVLPYCGKLLFIAVGNAYTGTQETVRRVVGGHPRRDDILVLDSVAASGQQGLICLAVQRYAAFHTDFQNVVAYAERQIEICREYLFIPDLQYLKRSGRIGSIKASVATALSIKPIVGHGPEGAVTYAKVKSREAAVQEIIRRIRRHPGQEELLLMVEYTDNRPYAENLRETLRIALGPSVEVVLAPLSSSSSVNMGPGTWGIAATRL